MILAAASPARGDVSAAAVQRAIDRGVEYLRKTQNERGGWPEQPGYSCGLSALCTLALLNAGVARDDPDMVRALRYLRTCQPNKTYSVALQTLVFCQAGAAGDLQRIRDNVRWLSDTQRPGAAGDRAGAWGYGDARPTGDPSNSQFALLALGAAVDRGIQVDRRVFELASGYWERRQLSSGGWSYLGGNPTGSMTCAGIASLIIARGRMGDAERRIAAERLECCRGEDGGPDPIEAGLEKLGRMFTVRANPGQSLYYYYYMYALERVGRLSGRRFIGDHDWYREGADQLVQLQDNFQGFWAGTNNESDRNVATSFALLFLSKGKRQVVVGRLRYGEGPEDSRWQQHPDALRQLVRHVQRGWGRDLTWQTVDGPQATVQDLLQTPVLVISGREPLRLPDALAERLGEYLRQGGCILFEADAGNGCGPAPGFEASVRALCQRWFGNAPLEKLPPTHPVWFAESRVDPEALGDDFWVEGVQACCRTPVFFVPKSLSCRWELGGQLFRRSETVSSVRKQVEAAIRLGENVIAYATGRELKNKLEERLVLEGITLDRPARGVIRMARLELGAGGDQAARALPHAAAMIGDRIPINVAAARNSVGFDLETLSNVPVLWLHGQSEFELSPDERQSLRQYVRNGGLIFASAICGDEAFATSFRREISETLPEASLRPMPADHPALTNAFGGFDIRNLPVRIPARTGESLKINERRQPPELEVASVDGADAVFFSPLDVSCALESQNSVQCPGYKTADAAQIVANLLLYALQQ